MSGSITPSRTRRPTVSSAFQYVKTWKCVLSSDLYVSNWGTKPGWNRDDTEILELIMADVDRATSFFMNRLSNYKLSHEPLNHIQVLGLSRDGRAAAVIRPYLEGVETGRTVRRCPELSSTSSVWVVSSDSTLPTLPAPSIEKVSSPRPGSVTEPVIRLPLVSTTMPGPDGYAVETRK